jgi:mRNA deadenylase 3'-5' endonuclease subunit Ccr4
MSSDEEEEEEDNVEEDEDDEKDDEETDEIIQKNREQSILNDLNKLEDIFEYIDQTSSRISEHARITELLRVIQTNQNFDNRNLSQGTGPRNQVNWSNYESLTELERAELLEKALMVLASDEHTN